MFNAVGNDVLMLCNNAFLLGFSNEKGLFRLKRPLKNLKPRQAPVSKTLMVNQCFPRFLLF